MTTHIRRARAIPRARRSTSWTTGELQALFESTSPTQPRTEGTDTAETRALLAVSVGAHLR